MELSFELLREAGVRLPGAMGNTIGIVGGLIIGQAAVDANIVSPMVVIVVAFTALCSFAIPSEGSSNVLMPSSSSVNVRLNCCGRPGCGCPEPWEIPLGSWAD